MMAIVLNLDSNSHSNTCWHLTHMQNQLVRDQRTSTTELLHKHMSLSNNLFVVSVCAPKRHRNIIPRHTDEATVSCAQVMLKPRNTLGDLLGLKSADIKIDILGCRMTYTKPQG